MPKEIKILIPDFESDMHCDIHIELSDKRLAPAYRMEIWDINKDNPNQLKTPDFLREKINQYDPDWIVAEVFAQENTKIPILFRQKQAKH